MNYRTNTSMRAALIAAATLAASLAAFAQGGVAVSYCDLDLAQPAGISVVHGRQLVASLRP